MRLTLRTLLAYLDDRLPSANAREIGKKLTESPFAQDLADRIKTVMRQRRLTSPGRKVKMIDPNLIAEYLDDQLTPELVSLIEKEVLSSDFSLAEVAASHEIIGLLGDPMELDEQLRERLLKQSPYRSAEESTDHEIDQLEQKKLSDPSQEMWKPMAPQRVFSPRSPALILAALLIGWLALLLTDPRFMGGHDDQKTARAERRAPAGQHEHPHTDEPPSDDDQAADAVGENDQRGAESGNEKPVSVDSSPGPSDSASPPDTSSADNEVASADSTETPANSPPSPEPMPVDSDESSDPVSPTSDGDAASGDGPPVTALVAQEFEYVIDDPGRMLLSRPLDGGDWGRAVVLQANRTNWRRTMTDRLSALSEPFSTSVSPGDVGWTARFVSPCVFRLDDGVHPQVWLYDGHCVVAQDLLDDPLTARGIDLVAGGVHVLVSPSGKDFRLGITVTPLDAVAVQEEGPAGADPTDTEYLPLGSEVGVSLFVAAGEFTIQPNEGKSVTIGKGRALQWTTDSGKLNNLVLSDPRQLDVIPDWVHVAGTPAVPEIEAASGKILAAMNTSESPLEAARELCSDRSPLVARYGASVLSVSRDVDQLVQVLLQTEEEEVRIETIYGVRQAAAQTLAGWRAVSKALENRLPRRDLEDFVSLMQGFSEAEAADEAMSQWLVSMLNHDRAALRQLAFMNIVELTGERNGYHPDSDRRGRSDAVRRWERWLKRNGNRLLSAE